MSGAALLSTLATLTPADLREAQARINVLLGAGSASDVAVKHPGPAEALLHDAMAATLAEHGCKRVPPLNVVLKFPHAGEFRKAAAAVAEFTDLYLSPRTRLDKAKAAGLLAVFAARSITAGAAYSRRPLSHRTLCQALARCEEVVDNAFPGYKAAGLLPMLLKRQRGPWPSNEAL